jgi:hypothetical protein
VLGRALKMPPTRNGLCRSFLNVRKNMEKDVKTEKLGFFNTFLKHFFRVHFQTRKQQKFNVFVFEKYIVGSPKKFDNL